MNMYFQIIDYPCPQWGTSPVTYMFLLLTSAMQILLEISCLYIKVSMVNDFLVSHMLFWGKKQNPQTALVNWFL